MYSRPSLCAQSAQRGRRASEDRHASKAVYTCSIFDVVDVALRTQYSVYGLTIRLRFTCVGQLSVSDVGPDETRPMKFISDLCSSLMTMSVSTDSPYDSLR